MRCHLALLAAATASLAACTNDIGSQADFSTDSWQSPTVHGELDFEDGNGAQFTSGERFHGWFFTLTAESEVALDIVPKVANLDTVAYLYNANEDGKKTGAYLIKNDDADATTLGSRIAESLPAGTYFLQVKAAKTIMTGFFAVEAGCIGAGCPVPPTPGAEMYCDGAEESIGKCMDDSLDATYEECAPSTGSASAVLCCNLRPEEYFCSDVCSTGALQLARYWSSDTDPLYEAFPEDDYSGLMDVYDYAVASCYNPTLPALQDLILAADDLEHEEEWTVDGWTMAGDSEFFTWTITEALINKAQGITGEAPTARFSAWVEIPCPNCTDGYAKDALWFEQGGRLLVLDSRWGGGS